jgi:hypothetical protein
MKKVNYCLVEDRKVLLCMEGFFCKTFVKYGMRLKRCAEDSMS